MDTTTSKDEHARRVKLRALEDGDTYCGYWVRVVEADGLLFGQVMKVQHSFVDGDHPVWETRPFPMQSANAVGFDPTDIARAIASHRVLVILEAEASDAS